MSQTVLNVRMDANLKKQFDALCAEFGMTASTAVTIFVKTIVRERKIPFKLQLLILFIVKPTNNTVQRL